MKNFDQWITRHPIEWRKDNVQTKGVGTLARSSISVDPARRFVGRRSLARHPHRVGQLAAGMP